MPFIVVNGPVIKDIEKKRIVVKEITDVISRVYEQPKENITVLIREDEPTNVAQGGKLLIDR